MAQPELTLEGEIVLGRYRVGKLIGAGGMCFVFEATHQTLDQRVAIKVLSPAAAKNPAAAKRFLREARAVARLRDRHVIRISDCAYHGELPCMVMELLQGNDLGKELADNRRLPVETAVDYVLQACVAIAEAHARGIVHRDLKPGNLFLSREVDGRSEIKVLDFGISKTVLESDGSVDLTKDTSVLGSLRYMSPEQVDDPSNVDYRTDIWSLGVVLYRLVAGRCPFIGANDLAAVARILRTRPPPLTELEPSVPPELERVVLRCLEKDRAQRLQSVLELARELAPFGPSNAREYIQSIERISQQSSGAPSSQPPLESTLDVATADLLTNPLQQTLQTDHSAVATSPVPPKAAARWPWLAAALGLVGIAGYLGSRREAQPVVPAAAAPAVQENRLAAPTNEPVDPALSLPPAAPSVPSAEPSPRASQPREAPPSSGGGGGVATAATKAPTPKPTSSATMPYKYRLTEDPVPTRHSAGQR